MMVCPGVPLACRKNLSTSKDLTKYLLIMKLNEALEKLKSLGNERMRTLNIRQGVGDNQYGVKLGDIRKLATTIKKDHALAMLQRRGRVAYRMLKRQFNLDDDALEELGSLRVGAYVTADGEKENEQLYWIDQLDIED